MNLRRLIMALTFLSIFAMAARFSIDTDTWWHLRTGQTISENREVPKSDPFSHTRTGALWSHPSAAWLSELRLFWLFDRFGPGALNLWVAAVVTAAFALIYFTMSGGPFLRAFTLILGAAASSVFWAARPYMTSFFFAAVFIWLLEGARMGKRKRLYLLPLVMLFWVNSHPGFAIGFLLVGIYFVDGAVAVLGESFGENNHFSSQKLLSVAGKQLGGYLISILFMLLAASINPSGPAILAYPFQTLSIGILHDFIEEWQSPNFHNVEMQPFLLLLLLCIGVLGVSKKRISMSDLLLIVIFASMGLLAGRNVAHFALVAPIVLTRHAHPILTEWSHKFGIHLDTSFKPTRNQSALNWLLVMATFFAVSLKVSRILPLEENQIAYARQVPTGAVEFIQREKPPGKLFNSYNWGGYLIWALPDYPVFVDGRTDLYDDEFLTEWLQIVTAEPGWQDRLAQRDTRLILLEPEWPLVSQLEEEGWRQIYHDDLAVIYSR